MQLPLLGLTVLAMLVAPTTAAHMALASQEFFVPMPEQLTFEKTLKKISSIASPPIHTLVSVTISTNGTIVYWDHWEDGYEDPLDPSMQVTTEVWGDGNATNGCAPRKGRTCTDENDRLVAGQAVILENRIDIPRVLAGHVLYDGGDNIKTTYPVAVTRGAYTQKPGSLLAGATEYVALYCQARHDNTTLQFKGEKTTSLNKGESYVYEYVHVGDLLTASKPIQVHLVTGDRGSMYEMRWFTLLPRGLYSRSFVTPVGNSKAGAKLVLFNPSNASVDATYMWLEDGSTRSTTITIPALKNTLSAVIPTGSGAYIDSEGGEIIAMAVVDTENDGQLYDWGFPVMPRDSLTAQVLIGLGYGCTDNACDSDGVRSVVWVTTVDDADLFIDYDNDGTIDERRSVLELSSNLIADPTDDDMSGAFIFATKAGSGENGAPVCFAAAWGQNPDSSYKNDAFALDLGTVIVPFPSIKVSKHVELAEDINGDGLFGPGDTVNFIIRVSNQSARKIYKGDFTVVDPALDQMTYIDRSTKYMCSANTTFDISDDESNSTRFPLDDAGLASKCTLHGRGDEHVITFQARIVDANLLTSDILTNLGTMRSNVGRDLSFEVTVPLVRPTETPTAAPFAASPLSTVLPTDQPTGAPTLKYSLMPTHAMVSSSPTDECSGSNNRKILNLSATKTEINHSDEASENYM